MTILIHGGKLFLIQISCIEKYERWRYGWIKYFCSQAGRPLCFLKVIPLLNTWWRSCASASETKWSCRDAWCKQNAFNDQEKIDFCFMRNKILPVGTVNKNITLLTKQKKKSPQGTFNDCSGMHFLAFGISLADRNSYYGNTPFFPQRWDIYWIRGRIAFIFLNTYFELIV